MSISITEEFEPDQVIADKIHETLVAYNLSQTKAKDRPHGTLAIYLRDDETQEVTGGLLAEYGGDWMFVKYLAIPEQERGKGLGRTLMGKAEAQARALGLTGIWLDSFTFQAPGFYEKLGFAAFGAIEDFPPGHSRIFLSKILNPTHPSE